VRPADGSIGLRCHNLEKRFGSLIALRNVNLEITPGQAVALAGHNGSGKTTFLRIAAGLTRPTSGKIYIGPEEVSGPGKRGNAGFVAHQTMLYDELTAEENLLLFARLQGIEEPAGRAEELLKEVGLAERGDSLVRTFSRGMRQRLTLARALLNRPELLLLDEPGTGLDTPGVAWLAETLKRLHTEGRTIVMSLHGQPELATLATRAIRLQAGKIVADSASGGPLESVLRVEAC
jgi:heme exporter protein A